MSEAIDAVGDGFRRFSLGEANVPLRSGIHIPEANGTILFMPVYMPSAGKVGLKVVSVFKDNPALHLPAIHALVVIVDAGTGKPLALMDGEYLTALRTGAASGVATKLLAREDSKVCAVIGAGVQGRTQLQAVCAVRPIKRALILDKHLNNARNFKDEISAGLAIPAEVISSSRDLKKADIICTATTATKPVFSDSDISPGTHINGVGSYKPHMREIPAETIPRSRLVVDQREACLSEAGDIIIPIKEGRMDANFIHAEIGEIISGQKSGRQDEREVTVFKSVGNAVQDLAVADAILKKAEKLGLGTKLNL